MDPLIGRGNEVNRAIQILCRRNKNNPLLVGDPGVGKTAIAEGLARKIIEGDVPDVLRDNIIYSLDMGVLLAGTRYRGDFEERPKQIMTELKTCLKRFCLSTRLYRHRGGGNLRGCDGRLESAGTGLQSGACGAWADDL